MANPPFGVQSESFLLIPGPPAMKDMTDHGPGYANPPVNEGCYVNVGPSLNMREHHLQVLDASGLNGVDAAGAKPASIALFN